MIADSLYQYDYGQILLLEGEVPESYEVHFSNNATTGETIRRVGSIDGTIIPNDLLRTGLDVFGFVFVTGETNGRTICCVHIPVKPRSKPTNLQ